MKKYFVYLDDGDNAYKVAVPADNEKAARAYAEGNGEIIAAKDVTSDFQISNTKIAKALKDAGFGQYETDFVTRALYQIGIADWN